MLDELKPLNTEEGNNQTEAQNNFFNFDNLNKIFDRIEKNYKHLSELEKNYYYSGKDFTPNDTASKIALLEDKIRTIYARKCISVVSTHTNNNTNISSNSHTPTPINYESKEAYLLRVKAELLRKLQETEMTIKMLTNERR
jgi:hypothetical protein